MKTAQDGESPIHRSEKRRLPEGGVTTSKGLAANGSEEEEGERGDEWTVTGAGTRPATGKKKKKKRKPQGNGKAASPPQVRDLN